MRALVLDAYGLSPHVAELPVPVPGAGQVRVRVRATSVNPIDWKQASGMFRPILSARFPAFIPGYDLAGEVDAVGPGVTGFVPGQRVHARLSGSAAGASAEYALAGLDSLHHLPDSVEFAAGAGLPLAGMTALQGLRDVLGLPLSGASGRLLVVGASGGVGHLAVQLARQAGTHVTGVCSGKNAALVQRLGAHAVVDYTQAGAWNGIAPFDAILDCVGVPVGEFLGRLLPGGRFASCLPSPAVFAHAALNPLRGKKVLPVLLKANAADLGVLDGLAEKGLLEVVVDSRFPAEQLAAAWARSRTGRAVGKIIVDF
jgi:NADPH:quinone reductase-like Zn-dependent oxidoreductase